ncbi:insulinase family protein [bacterium]|nr:insulinase family protein [bacterium]
MRRNIWGLTVLLLALVCSLPALAEPKPAGSPYEFTKKLSKIHPPATTYTLYDRDDKAEQKKGKKEPGGAVNASSVQRFALPNGLRVLVQEVPYDDIVAIELLVRCGVFQEESNLAGYTNFVLEMLLNRVASDNGEDVAEITGSVADVGVTPDLARLSIVTSSKYCDYWLNRLCHALTVPEFSEKEAENVRSRLLISLKERGGGFSELYEIFLSQFYRYHPYKRSNFGNEAVIKKATAAALSDFYKRHFGADHMVISVSGRASAPELVNIIKAQLSGLEPHPDEVVATQWEAQAQEKEMYLSSSANMAWVLLGYPAPPMLSSDYAAMRLATAAIGSGLSSRLWLELREKRGLAYELSGRFPELSGPSHFLCYAVCKPTSIGEVRRRMKAELKRFRDEGISAQELEDTRNMLIGEYLLKRETNAGRALRVGMAELLGPGYSADAQYLYELRKVTVADVNRVAKKYLNEPCLLVARPGGRFYLDW